MKNKSVHLMKMKSHIPPPQYDKAMHLNRAFKLEQMSLSFQLCTIYKERRLEMNMSSHGVCHRCFRIKTHKMFSAENNMDPGEVPLELSNLRVID